ncbi:MAG: MFS transporter [Pyrobaculum sp.]
MNLGLILLLGLVSFFADWLYESMRAVAPQYLQHLGATAAFVGFVFGLGDALGYAARFVTGPLADRRGGYWLETFLGYGLQLAAIAGLLFTRDLWQVAALIFLERFSKALRTPARDVIISSAGGEEAKGRAFGIHAALDQLGAVTGVVMATAMLYSSYEPQDVFKASLIPGLAALLTLYIAYRVAGIKPERRRDTTIALTEDVFLFGLAQFFLGLSTVHISLSMYRLYRFAEVAWMGSLLYLVAMIAEVLASPALGYLADKSKRSVLTAPFFSVLLAFTYFAGAVHPALLFLGAVFYSIVTSYTDVIAKAHAAKLGGAASLGFVNAMWGFGSLLGAVLYGYLTDRYAYELIVALAAVSALASLVIIWRQIGS